MIIELDKTIIDKCTDFANKRIEGSSNLYRYRGESNKDKMIEDCIIGTLGEFAAHKYLSDKGIVVSEPDLTIYETKRKSFSADLFNEELKIHVKSQSEKSFKRYGMSYLLQRKDRIITSPENNEYFVFVKVGGIFCEIVGTCKIKDIVDNSLWGECKVPSYRHSKVALYIDELGSIDLEVL